jgi:tetratricopeptide (TPR) repeat protein
LRICRESLSGSPEFASCFRRLGAALRQRGHDADASEFVREALRLQPQDAANHALLGLIHASQGDPAAAGACFRQALLLKPESSEATESFLSRLSQGARTLEGPAIELFFTTSETSIQAEQFRAMLMLAVGRDQQAYSRICRRLMDAHEQTNDAGAAEQVARICGAASLSPVEPERIVGLAERALQLGSQGGWTRYTVGLAYFRAGRYQEALQRFEESGKVDPNWSATALNWPLLAMAHHHLGHASEARTWLSKAAAARIASEPFWNDPLEMSLHLEEAREVIK